MYEDFYGLVAAPFSLLPDADCLFWGRTHRQAGNALECWVQSYASFMVLTGDAGTGKTSLLRHFMNHADEAICWGSLTNPLMIQDRFFAALCSVFEVSYEHGEDEVSLYHKFVDFLVSQYAVQRRAVLVLDEAQALDARQLETVRMLANVNNEKDHLIQIVLAGQSDFLDRLQTPAFQPLLQRVLIQNHVTPLDQAETESYIRYRLQAAGSQRDLFEKKALIAIYHHTGGVPRLINLLCDAALLYGFAEDTPCISAALIKAVIKDRQENGATPFIQDKRIKNDKITSLVTPLYAASERFPDEDSHAHQKRA
ncbi:MAG: ExeA family protein [Bdellovibrionales bacterium]